MVGNLQIAAIIFPIDDANSLVVSWPKIRKELI